jgi:hypothetical protein
MSKPATAATAAPEPIEDSITPLISTLTFGGRVFARALSRISLEGAVDEIPMEGPLILAANHTSNLDAIVLGSWLMPKLGRRIHWLGKKAFAWPIVGWAAATRGPPGDRERPMWAFRLPADPRRGSRPVRVSGGAQPDGALQEVQDGVAVLRVDGRADHRSRSRARNRVWPKGRTLPARADTSRLGSAPVPPATSSARHGPPHGETLVTRESWSASRPPAAVAVASTGRMKSRDKAHGTGRRGRIAKRTGCYGVREAIDKAGGPAAGKSTHTLGQVVHNEASATFRPASKRSNTDELHGVAPSSSAPSVRPDAAARQGAAWSHLAPAPAIQERAN